MKRTFSILSLLFVLVWGCQKDDLELSSPPTASDATFSFTTSSSSDNIINFTTSRTDVIARWDFGNGTSAEGPSVVATYPRKGDYTVTLTVYTSGGSASSTQTINIAQDDFSLLSDPLFTILTGGIDSVNGRTWVIDSMQAGHIGVGPNPSSALGDIPEYWAAPPNDKSGVGLYDDRYTFYLDAFKFDMKNNDDVYVHGDVKDDFPGSFQNKGDYTAPYQNQLGESWLLQFDEGSDTTLTVSGNSFLGFYTGVRTYKVVSISENKIVLRYLMSTNNDLAWYMTLIPEGFDSGSGGGGGGGGGGGTGFTLPMDFESVEPTFEGFGGSTVSVIDNPDKRSINTSDRVLETVHGNETWAGISVNLDSKLDFSSQSKIALKIWTPNVSDTIRVKIEDQNDSDTYVEIDVAIPIRFNWVEVEADFSGAASGTYDKLVLFPGWNTTTATSYQIDDIVQR